MAEKAKLFADWKIRKEILGSDNARIVKQLGRKVRGFEDCKWKKERLRIFFHTIKIILKTPVSSWRPVETSIAQFRYRQ